MSGEPLPYVRADSAMGSGWKTVLFRASGDRPGYNLKWDAVATAEEARDVSGDPLMQDPFMRGWRGGESIRCVGRGAWLVRGTVDEIEETCEILKVLER